VPDEIWNDDAASRYDTSDGPHFESAAIRATVDVLADLAGDGAALELAIGTGRIAVPLAERGVRVSGIDSSAPMLAELGRKSSAHEIDAILGDMTTTRVDGTFQLVYLVFNTIGNVMTQHAQVACFVNAAAHLAPGGHFVIEVGVPRLRELPPGTDAQVFTHSPGYVGYDRYTDLVAQQAMSHHFRAGASGTQEFRTPFRYVWPSELDLMARIAGMSLRDRWADWSRSPFTGESPSHVSVWQLD